MYAHAKPGNMVGGAVPYQQDTSHNTSVLWVESDSVFVTFICGRGRTDYSSLSLMKSTVCYNISRCGGGGGGGGDERRGREGRG